MSTTHQVTMTHDGWQALKDGRPEPLDLRDVLCWTFHAFCMQRGYAPRSACELLHIYSDDMPDADADWLRAYVRLWDASDALDAVAFNTGATG